MTHYYAPFPKNYTSNDKKYLLGLVNRFEDIIESKDTSAAMCRRKEETWSTIALRYRIVCETGGRSIEELQDLYESLRPRRTVRQSKSNPDTDKKDSTKTKVKARKRNAQTSSSPTTSSQQLHVKGVDELNEEASSNTSMSNPETDKRDSAKTEGIAKQQNAQTVSSPTTSSQQGVDELNEEESSNTKETSSTDDVADTSEKTVDIDKQAQTVARPKIAPLQLEQTVSGGDTGTLTAPVISVDAIFRRLYEVCKEAERKKLKSDEDNISDSSIYEVFPCGDAATITALAGECTSSSRCTECFPLVGGDTVTITAPETECRSSSRDAVFFPVDGGDVETRTASVDPLFLRLYETCELAAREKLKREGCSISPESSSEFIPCKGGETETITAPETECSRDTEFFPVDGCEETMIAPECGLFVHLYKKLILNEKKISPASSSEFFPLDGPSQEPVNETYRSPAKEEYFKQKLQNAILERKFLIERHKMEEEKYKLEIQILKLQRDKLLQ